MLLHAASANGLHTPVASTPRIPRWPRRRSARTRELEIALAAEQGVLEEVATSIRQRADGASYVSGRHVE
jgi:hypothetical protein